MGKILKRCDLCGDFHAAYLVDDPKFGKRILCYKCWKATTTGQVAEKELRLAETARNEKMNEEESFQALCTQAAGLMDRHSIPGVVLGIWHTGREKIAGLGVTSVEHPLPVTSDTLLGQQQAAFCFDIPGS